jgi:hypothetical protein
VYGLGDGLGLGLDIESICTVFIRTVSRTTVSSRHAETNEVISVYIAAANTVKSTLFF